MTSVVEASPARTRTGPPSVPWREPAYVLLFVAGVVADMINGNAKLIGFPISPDRLLFGGAIVLLLTDPDVRRQVRLRWRVVHTLMVATLVWVAGSGFVAGTILTSYGLYAWLDRLAVPFAAFTLAPVVFATPQRRDLLLKTLTVMGVYLGPTAFFEVIGPHALVVPRYIMDPSVGIHFGYARGPFLEAEADGLTMIACGLAAGVLITRTASRRWRGAAVFTIASCGFGGLLAQERSIWIGESLAIAVACLLVPRLRRLLPLVAVGIALLVGLALTVSPSLRHKISGRASYSTSVYDRRNTDAAAIRIIEARPIDGIGWVEFEQHGRDYVRLSPDYPITNVNIEVHNVYLGRAAETGVPGALLFVGSLLAGPARAVLRRFRPGLGDAPDAVGWHVVASGVTVSWLVVSMLSPLPYPLPNLLLWLVAGIVLAPWLADPAPDAPAVTADGLVVPARAATAA